MLFLAVTPAAQAAGCTDNWSDMASAVAANSLTPAKDLQKLAASKVAGKIIKISLCQATSGYRYELVFLDAGGKVQTLAVDARSPFPQ